MLTITSFAFSEFAYPIVSSIALHLFFLGHIANSREDVDGGVYVEGLSEHVVKTAEEVRELLHRGAAMRTTAATQMNRESSRSHAVFTIIVEHSETTASGEVKVS